MKVEIYSDVACPWCYVGKVRFERALGAFPQADEVEVSYRPFQLNPATPEQAQSLYEYYDERFGPGFRDNHARISDVLHGFRRMLREVARLGAGILEAFRKTLVEREHGDGKHREPPRERGVAPCKERLRVGIDDPLRAR